MLPIWKKYYACLILCLATPILHCSAQKVKIKDEKLFQALVQLYPECFEADQLNTQCNSIVNEDTLVLSQQGLRNIDELSYFTNLKKLNISNNFIITLPSLNAGLKTLIMYSNNVSIISQLPAGLNFLDCTDNGLRNITYLPDSLCVLQILQGNFINCLPNLPSVCLDAQYFDTYQVCMPQQLTSSIHINEIKVWIDDNNIIRCNDELKNSQNRWKLYNNKGVLIASDSDGKYTPDALSIPVSGVYRLLIGNENMDLNLISLIAQ